MCENFIINFLCLLNNRIICIILSFFLCGSLSERNSERTIPYISFRLSKEQKILCLSFLPSVWYYFQHLILTTGKSILIWAISFVLLQAYLVHICALHLELTLWINQFYPSICLHCYLCWSHLNFDLFFTVIKGLSNGGSWTVRFLSYCLEDLKVHVLGSSVIWELPSTDPTLRFVSHVLDGVFSHSSCLLRWANQRMVLASFWNVRLYVLPW